MKILKREQGIFVSKPEGTSVIYHIFEEFEIHLNEIAARTVQPWHHHQQIEEVLYLTSGELEAR